jgi:hypothetical protein
MKKQRYLMSIATLALASLCFAETKTRTVSFVDIATGGVTVVGRLGLPVGTATEVTGKFVERTHPGFGPQYRTYTFSVTAVGDKPLPEPMDFEFEIENEYNALLAKSVGELKALLADLVAENELHPKQAEKLEKEYAEITRKLVVWECAYFEGRPPTLGFSKPMTSGEKLFRFSSRLIIAQTEKLWKYEEPKILIRE